MESTRYSSGAGVRPGSLFLSGGLVALMITGIMFAAPDIGKTIGKLPPLITYQVPNPPKPEPLPKPQPEQRTITKLRQQPREPVEQPPIIIATVPSGPIFAPGDPVTIDQPPGTGIGSGGGVAIDPPAPVFTEASADPRYADQFQPLYPAEERRLGVEGLVKVRVLIGTDGRVKAIEPVSAASPGFLDATRRQALSKWRFRPATRDGVPIERWRIMRVNFVLTEE